MPVESDTCASPRVGGACRFGSVVGGVCLGPRGDCSDAEREPVFKGQMSLIQMVFHKEGRGGIGGTERICRMGRMN